MTCFLLFGYINVVNATELKSESGGTCHELFVEHASSLPDDCSTLTCWCTDNVLSVSDNANRL